MDIQSSDRIILRALRGGSGGRIESCVLSSIWFDDTHLLFTSKKSIDQSYLNHMSGFFFMLNKQKEKGVTLLHDLRDNE